MGHIHSNSEYDFTVSAVIIYQDKVLLQFHKKLQFWVPPAGHVELDETPSQALYRELEEESGLTKAQVTLFSPYTDSLHLERDTINRVEPVPFDIDAHPIGTDGHRHIDFAYALESNTDAVKLEEEAAEQLAWFTLDQIKQLSPVPKLVYSRSAYALQLVRGDQQ